MFNRQLTEAWRMRFNRSWTGFAAKFRPMPKFSLSYAGVVLELPWRHVSLTSHVCISPMLMHAYLHPICWNTCFHTRSNNYAACTSRGLQNPNELPVFSPKIHANLYSDHAQKSNASNLNMQIWNITTYTAEVFRRNVMHQRSIFRKTHGPGFHWIRQNTWSDTKPHSTKTIPTHKPTIACSGRVGKPRMSSNNHRRCLIMLIKKAISKWDAVSVRFCFCGSGDVAMCARLLIPEANRAKS